MYWMAYIYEISKYTKSQVEINHFEKCPQARPDVTEARDWSPLQPIRCRASNPAEYRIDKCRHTNTNRNTQIQIVWRSSQWEESSGKLAEFSKKRFWSNYRMLFLQKCLTTVNQHVGAFVISTVSYVAAEIGEHINKLAKINELAKINSTKNDAEAFALNYFTKRWNQNIALRLRMSQYEQSKDILSWDSYKCIFVTDIMSAWL